MSNMNHEPQHLTAADAAGARPVGRVGIVGAGADGIAIAKQLLDAGVPVTLYESDAATLRDATSAIRSGWPGTGDGRLALLAATVNFHHLKDADVLIDASDNTSEAAGREGLFHRLDQTAKSGAILATTARAGLDQLACRTRRAGEVLGLRLVHPGQAWEIVPGKETSGASLATMLALSRQSVSRAAVGG